MFHGLRGKDYEKFMEEARARNKNVAQWLAEGMSQSEIARKIGVSRQRIQQLAKKVVK